MKREGGKKRKYFLPDVEMKGNVRFNLQLVFLCRLKYAVLVAVLEFKDLAVEKPERKRQTSVYQRERGVFDSGKH